MVTVAMNHVNACVGSAIATQRMRVKVALVNRDIHEHYVIDWQIYVVRIFVYSRFVMILLTRRLFYVSNEQSM